MDYPQATISVQTSYSPMSGGLCSSKCLKNGQISFLSPSRATDSESALITFGQLIDSCASNAENSQRQ